MTRVVFLLTPGVILLDLAGPAQVFSSSAIPGGYELTYVAEQTTVPSAQGLPLAASLAWPRLDRDDVIVVPGWQRPRRPVEGLWSQSTLQHLRYHHAAGGVVISVCSGALMLGHAGLLDGRRCTTHHNIQDELQRRHPLAHVVPDVLFTEDDQIMTSAGIASGIDLALHVIATRHGPAVAARVARDMVVYARRNGEAPQLSALLRHRSHIDELVHRVQDVIDERFAETLPLPLLADVANVSARTLTRSFSTAIGMSPLRYQQSLRRERADLLIAQGATTDRAAREVGFVDARMLRRLRRVHDA